MNVVYKHQMNDMDAQNDSEMPSLFLSEVSPNPSIIISHDGEKVLSRYEDDKWDLNPYSLSPNKEPVFDFFRILDISSEVSALERQIVDEMKHFLLVLLYVHRGGRFGSISVATFRKHFYSLAEMGRFCIKVNSEDSHHVISLRDILSSSHFFGLFSKANPGVLSKRPMVDTFNSFRAVSQKYLGVKVATINFDENAAREHNQHPVIPADIYLNLVNGLSADIEFFGSVSERLTNLIAEFEDKAVGRSYPTQDKLGISKKAYRMTVPEVIEKHQLVILFVGHYNVSSLASLITALMKIQYVCLHTIVLYTGMRITEALNMPFDCICEEVLTPAVIDDDGNVAVEAEVIEVVSFGGRHDEKLTLVNDGTTSVSAKTEVSKISSYTTKFTGTKETASWLANEDVTKAIRILQGINMGFCRSEQKDFSDTLFVCPNHLKGKSRVRTQFKPSMHQPDWYSTLLIQQEDLDLLRASNPEDKLKEERFILGEPWPLTAHQFRRSLAFYAANSGFVSLPTLTVQFKHLASGMTKYYSRNFENIKAIFGYFNPETNSFDIPSEHTLYGFKEARVAVVVDALVNDVVHTDQVLYGKSSNYIQKQRADIESPDDPVTVLEVRKKTEEAVSHGEIYYRQTLLGGCTNVDQCDCRMLGEFTSCLSNACAVIKPHNVSEQISELTKYIDLLEPGTGEHQVVEEELSALIIFQKREQERKV